MWDSSGADVEVPAQMWNCPGADVGGGGPVPRRRDGGARARGPVPPRPVRYSRRREMEALARRLGGEASFTGTRVLTGTHGYSWVLTGAHGYSWVLTGTHGYSWVLTGAHGYSRRREMEALAQRLGGEGSFTAKSGRGMDWSDALLFHHTDFGAAETTPAQADEGATLHEYSKYPHFRPPARPP
jgi:hypothetical protein